MNRTYDEPETETDVMAAAFRTIRRYGMTIITATQHMDVNGYVKTDPRMPRTRLRRYLGQYGLRGEALNREVRRIVAGPERRDSKLKDGIYGTVAKLAMRQPFVLFKGLTFQKLCLPGAFRPG
ncbi:hypothetical protein NO741_26995, partial [Klebsiella pneumoniae]|nr:hypothetical protein [Klebsiella pneumoniae]